ncbi:hypothetical protein MMC22_008893 [Lobaria immixta]|nr:hypothetical protein [Lobaria immixta]
MPSLVASTISPLHFVATSFDYLVAGGGTAGLTLAARLTEDPKVTVGVIEAGLDRSTDPKVLTPGLATSLWDDPDYDWLFKTTPQTHGNNRVVAHPRGKILGGSSGVNLNLWTHASQKDINDWGKLGNKGWSWDTIFPYFAKSEKYIPHTAQEGLENEASYIDPTIHGKNGPIKNSFSPFQGNFNAAWDPTFETLGIRLNGDPKDGLALGAYHNLLSYDPINASRSFSANAYYSPHAKRPNLKILTDALVNKIIFASVTDYGTSLVATGLSFTARGKKYAVNASREVIISAGTFQSPQLLELSGIGNKSLLDAHGIKVLLENPNVGQNLQDHLLIPLGFQAADGEFTTEAFRDPKVFTAALETYHVNHTGPLTAASPSALLSYAQILTSSQRGPVPGRKLTASNTASKSGGEDTPGLSEQYDLVLRKLLDPNEASAQELFFTGGENPQFGDNISLLFQTDPVTTPDSYFTMFGILEHPFSRGSVHITSPDPTVASAIDPNYLSHPLDIVVTSSIALHLQTVAQTQPLASHLKNGGTVYQPGYQRLTEQNVAEQVRDTFSSEYHPIGTCAMQPAHKGGVVDERLRVYGTKNVRIVDASIFPLQVQANLQTLVYAVAERAADFIKADHR